MIHWLLSRYSICFHPLSYPRSSRPCSFFLAYFPHSSRVKDMSANPRSLPHRPSLSFVPTYPEISLFCSSFTLGQQTQLVCKIPPLAHTLVPRLSLELQLVSCWGEVAEEGHSVHLTSSLFSLSRPLHYWPIPETRVRRLFDMTSYSHPCALSLILHC